MVKINFQPVRFIRPGTEVEARFIGENDRLEWYKGTVKRVNFFGDDNSGTFINCSVLYEDGELVEESVFYDKDFDQEDNLDSWRFDGTVTMLISYIRQHTSEIEELKEELQTRRDMESEFTKLLEEELDDDYDPDEDEEDSDDDDEEDDTEEDSEDDDEEEDEDVHDEVQHECVYCKSLEALEAKTPKRSWHGFFNAALLVAAIVNIGVMTFAIMKHH